MIQHQPDDSELGTVAARGVAAGAVAGELRARRFGRAVSREAEAVRERYRFYSYGDCMLIT